MGAVNDGVRAIDFIGTHVKNGSIFMQNPGSGSGQALGYDYDTNSRIPPLKDARNLLPGKERCSGWSIHAGR
jgi:hypothetical protein